MSEEIPECDLLIFVTTDSEVEALLESGERLGLTVKQVMDEKLGIWFDLGTVGRLRTLAVRTRVGAGEHRGATSQAVIFQAKTNARLLVMAGMAFGISRAVQSPGEVLVSTSVFPYDRREVVDGPNGPVVDYRRTRRRRASPELIALIEAEVRRARPPFPVSFGQLLSGQTRISSRTFRDELLMSVPDSSDPVLGGDMEATALLAVAPASDPCWVVVKGISDFADGDSLHTRPEVRTAACRNAVGLVLSALLHESVV